MQLVPAIDLRGGQYVRLLQGRFDAETVYGNDPGVILGRYRDLGARYVHVVDLDGARDGSQGNRAAIAGLARAFADTAIQVGGGVRSREVVAELLELGVQRIVVGSVAGDPGLSAAALVGGDNLPAARAWVSEVLGPLARATDNDERLRVTAPSPGQTSHCTPRRYDAFRKSNGRPRAASVAVPTSWRWQPRALRP